jgi:malonyl CoA-acyl carrier protein transacylase
VRWHEINRALYERGVRAFVEMAPGNTLSHLAHLSLADVQTFALDKIGADALPRALRAVQN